MTPSEALIVAAMLMGFVALVWWLNRRERRR